MSKQPNIILVYIFLVFILGISCNTKQKEKEVFDSKEMIADITKNIILPSISNFEKQAILLEKQALAFAQNPTEESLVTAQEQWKNTAVSYANIYAFNIGVPKKKFMHHLLYNWPVFVNDFNKATASDNKINIDKISTRSKGLTGLEYLLFVSNDISNKKIVDLFIANPKRVSYLIPDEKDLKKQTLKLSEIWNGQQENYQEVFINNAETGLKSSLNMLCNGLFNVVGTVKKAKLGKPAGLQGSSSTNYDLLQAYRSEISLQLIRNNIASVQKVYFNTSGSGIADNVRFISKNNNINDKIRNQFANIDKAIDQIHMPLRLAIDQQKKPIEKLFKEITELVWLLNNDVRSTLSIIVTPTDNDGD